MSVLSRLAGPVGIGAIAAVAFTTSASAEQMQLPSDALMTCPVSEDTFQSWLQEKPSSTLPSWRASKNAAFKPASSVTFQQENGYNTDNCDFYRWGQQMFLWLTSPDTSDGAGWVLTGPSIYNVLPAVNGTRKLEAHHAGNETLNLAVRHNKPENIGEVGQAGRAAGVLISQTESLVYYGVHVNDLYAAFLTGHKAPDGPAALKEAKKFPRVKTDMDAVVKFASNHQPPIQIDRPETLAMELKTSWVRADTLPNKDKEDYFRITAVVPEYQPSQTEVFPPRLIPVSDASSNPVELALVGMHVVGTVQHHPEFVWASFEHVDNAPNAPYYYNYATDEKTGKLKYKKHVDPMGSYLFTDAKTNPADYSKANVECMRYDHDTGSIVAKTGDGGELVCKPLGFQASSTVRINPWGAEAADKALKARENNTLLISLNRSARGWLANDDVRRNYVQIGGLWTAPAENKGVDAPIPNISDFSKKPPVFNAEKDERGSRQLANATMETYEQEINCFVCHSLGDDAANSFVQFGLSHIFSEIDPLN